jgi:glycerate dehydrogenase
MIDKLASKPTTETIVFLDRGSLQANLRTPTFGHAWKDYSSTKPDDIVDRLSNATVAVVNKVRLPKAILQQLPRLKLIAVAATGTDVVDVDACAELNITVSNVRGYAVHSLFIGRLSMMVGGKTRSISVCSLNRCMI